MKSADVKLVEVGPRDGLQNEMQIVSTQDKIKFINLLSKTGLQFIEATSFVSAKKIPQLQDANTVMLNIERNPYVHYSALVPNLIGLEAAIKSNVKEIAVFSAVSETFTQKNIHCSIQESLQRFDDVIKKAKQEKVNVRAYISCVFGCPYEGKIAFEKTLQLTEYLIQQGCYEISLGDTIGVATPNQVKELISLLEKNLDTKKIALHFHDTYGQAIANIYAGLESGIRIFDSSVSGLGGCPYAKGASGNVASEDVVYLLEGVGFNTNINLDLLIQAGEFICSTLGKQTQSKVAIAKR